MNEDERRVIAAELADWKQVILNGGPPCFHLEEGCKFCLRAELWDGHKVRHAAHTYVSLAALLRQTALTPQAEDLIKQLVQWAKDKERLEQRIAQLERRNGELEGKS